MNKKIYIDLSVLINTNFLTGIQRVSREIVLRLLKSTDLNIVLLFYSNENECFRIIDNSAFIDHYENKIGTRGSCVLDTSLNINDLDAGSVFFDIDSVWSCRMTRSTLYPMLKNQGLKIITHVYDIIPITHPQYCHENTVMHFIEYLGATLQYADKLIVNTQATADQILTVCKRMNREMPPYVVAPLGCDFKKPDTDIVPTTHINEKGEEELDNEFKHLIPSPDVTDIIEAGKYILMVGTIEPRKNHSLVLDALDNGLNVNVVFAGRIGWNVAPLIARIKTHPLYQQRLFLINNANDAAINKLYENAFLLAFPTFNEGFGLPIIESIQRGTLVIASDLPVLREVGGEYTDYFDNTDCTALVKYVDKCLENPEKYNEKKAALKNYVPYTWDKSAEMMHNALADSLAPKEQVPSDLNLKQMVVLTARNDDIIATLPFIEEYMPFIKELVVCCPERNVEPFKQQYKGNLSLIFKTDDQLLNGRELPEDHQARNFFLRCLIMQLDDIDDVFIMTDDDYRPLKPISKDVFIKNGKYIGYYFYDITKWKGAFSKYTSFDEGAFKTRDFLVENGYPTLQYSSHQPQIIDKRIFREMLNTHKGIENKPYDEWSTYFNYGLYHHPDIFFPKINVSMCWPDKTSSWDLLYFPGPFLFENYYEEMYDKNALFDGFSKEFSPNQAEENIQKEFLFTSNLRKHFELRKVFESYSYHYADQIGEFPSFAIYLHPATKEIQLHVPKFIHLQNNCWTRVPLKIEDGVFEAYPDCTINVSYTFRNIREINILNSLKLPLKNNGNGEVLLPIRSPKSRINRGAMIFRVIVEKNLDTFEDIEDIENNNIQPKTELILEIEKILPVTLA